MFGTIIGLIILVAIVLILVILAQNSKGGGLSSQFGGSGTSQLMGVKKTGDLLEKLTWGLAIGLIILTLSTKFFMNTASTGTEADSPNIDRAQEKSVLPNLESPVDQSEGVESLDDALDPEPIDGE